MILTLCTHGMQLNSLQGREDPINVGRDPKDRKQGSILKVLEVSDPVNCHRSYGEISICKISTNRLVPRPYDSLCGYLRWPCLVTTSGNSFRSEQSVLWPCTVYKLGGVVVYGSAWLVSMACQGLSQGVPTQSTALTPLLTLGGCHFSNYISLLE